MSTTADSPSSESEVPAVKRRDFHYVATGAMAAVGTGIFVWPFIDSMNPSTDIFALFATEIDLSSIQAGQQITVKWRGQPVFIVRRTDDQITQAKADDENPDLIDPATDVVRYTTSFAVETYKDTTEIALA